MDKLLSELNRLYLLPDSPAAQRGPGPAADLVSGAGLVRAIAIPFRKAPGADAQHWEHLCTVANGLQADFGFPAPAVSVTSTGGFMLWLSLAAPVPVADARRFVAGLGLLWPDTLPPADTIGVPVELPPCPNAAAGTWAAFIHPGMGASFADESGLDMAPPAAGQVAFLESLDSIAPGQFSAALARLETPAAPAAAPPPLAADGLLLEDATLEDIVRVLHARGIEPTFRFTLPR
ncbi:MULTISPECIES: hypothetical protein [Massilia]|uniref:Uncharacterized protein n=1 Tax=Massilia orientalis TaxID=3050128 RepID=A0ACC7MKE6_9BURK|nr:hypothetical protein [Massilia sp. Root1485]KQZ40255.1 hypothetical protein ASD92_03190 [Massilia sp. Root1485]MDN4041110.1 hypothetical protein [Massilia sp. YIM B02787]